MCHPSIQEDQALKHILQILFGASGTTLKLDKSWFFFFNTPAITQINISRIFGFSISSFPTKYLGAPLIDSYIKHSSWWELLEKLKNITS